MRLFATLAIPALGACNAILGIGDTQLGDPNFDPDGGQGDAAVECDPGWAGPDCDECVVYVDGEGGSNSNAGRSWDDARATVPSGIEAAQARLDADSVDACSIWIRAGTYRPGTERTDAFELVSGVHLYGGFAGGETRREDRDWDAHETILSGDLERNDDPEESETLMDNAYHVVIGADDAVLDGFTVTAGAADGEEDNERRGGGMYNDDASPTVANVIFSSNTASGSGGAMFNTVDSAPSLTNVSFSGNIVSGVSDGGAMFNDRSSPTLTNVTFSENTASNNGGAMGNELSSVTLINVTFSGNTAGNLGGAMYNAFSSQLTLTNVSFFGNTAGSGGGMGSGGAVYIAGGATRIRNSILWGNEANVEGAEVFIEGGQVTITHSIVQGGKPAGVEVDDWVQSSDANPLFVEAPQNLRLLPQSTAIDSGNSGLEDLPDVDLDGNPRIAGDSIDMGAYEHQP